MPRHTNTQVSARVRRGKRGSSADSLVGQYQCLESKTSDYWEPVEVVEEGVYMKEFW